ncbi:MAG: DUF2630 family protein [Kineosporiaceae bacterium]|nr:DUF2630 family protein [Aeromicrobium sp.]
MTTDGGIHDIINSLVEEEKKLRTQLADHEISKDEEHERLHDVEVQLDRCWDLLRQRGAARSTGGNADDATVRTAEVVEHYEG